MMFKPTKKQVKLAVDYAKGYPDREVCGLFLKDKSFVEVENVFVSPSGKDLPVKLEDPTSGFAIPFEVYLRYGRDIVCIMHSHPDTEHLGPSRADVSAQEASGVPWMVVHGDGSWFVFDEEDCLSSIDFIPVVKDQLSFMEKSLGKRVERDQNWFEDPCALLALVDEQVLLGKYETLDELPAEFCPGDCVLGGDCPQSPPDTLAIFDLDGLFKYRHSNKEEAASEKVPCQHIHRILRLSD